MSDESDRMLVDAVAAGDRARFAELVERYEAVARAAVVAILHDTHLAQDVVQETFLLAYRNLGQLADRSRFGPWLLKIARRQALRTLGRRRQVQALPPADELPAASRNGQLDDDNAELLDAVARLPAQEQIAVVLHYFQDHKVETIAQLTGRSLGTVTKQLSRARRRLEAWLRRKDR